MLQFEAPKENSNYIKVIGVGGGGTNAINHMYNKGIEGVDFIVCNTDQKSLDSSPIQNKIKIGKDGLGAGNCPDKARASAMLAEEEIKQNKKIMDSRSLNDMIDKYLKNKENIIYDLFIVLTQREFSYTLGEDFIDDLR